MNSDSPQDRPWPQPYERPNQKWQCGRTDCVFPCALGPDTRGKCRTTSECSPVLDKKPGDEKGRFRCTRRPEYGGPCDEGPLPEGTCSHALPPCSPTRSLRSRRTIFALWVLGLTVATLLLLLHGESRYDFANPGPLSSVHAQPKGTQGRDLAATKNCSACHRTAGTELHQWVEAAAGANPHPFEFTGFVKAASDKPTRMDRACADCHRGHQFHHVNMQQEQSCLKCHQEHRGDLGLQMASDRQCVNCHGNSHRMDQAVTGLENVVLRSVDRPRASVTRFSKDHPEFAPIASKASDRNTLRFNHQKHLSSTISPPGGQPLQCVACHQQDAAGEYHQQIRFAQHCQSCHSLQFDPETPELQLPHGEVEFVRAFLGSLPQQYEEHAQRVRGITEKRALKAYVDSQMQRLQERQITGETFEDGIFHSRTRRLASSGSAVPFYGCAYCHEVTGHGSSVQVVKAEVPLRWLTKGAFQHSKHQNVACIVCHNAPASTQTRDILLPSVQTCASCHRSNAAPGESCTLCHKYHHTREQTTTFARGAPGSSHFP